MTPAELRDLTQSVGLPVAHRNRVIHSWLTSCLQLGDVRTDRTTEMLAFVEDMCPEHVFRGDSDSDALTHPSAADANSRDQRSATSVEMRRCMSFVLELAGFLPLRPSPMWHTIPPEVDRGICAAIRMRSMPLIRLLIERHGAQHIPVDEDIVDDVLEMNSDEHLLAFKRSCAMYVATEEVGDVSIIRYLWDNLPGVHLDMFVALDLEASDAVLDTPPVLEFLLDVGCHFGMMEGGMYEQVYELGIYSAVATICKRFPDLARSRPATPSNGAAVTFAFKDALYVSDIPAAEELAQYLPAESVATLANVESAVRGNRPAVVSFLLEYARTRCDDETCLKAVDSGLIAAIPCGHIDIVRLLLTHMSRITDPAYTLDDVHRPVDAPPSLLRELFDAGWRMRDQGATERSIVQAFDLGRREVARAIYESLSPEEASRMLALFRPRAFREAIIRFVSSSSSSGDAA